MRLRAACRVQRPRAACAPVQAVVHTAYAARDRTMQPPARFDAHISKKGGWNGAGVCAINKVRQGKKCMAASIAQSVARACQTLEAKAGDRADPADAKAEADARARLQHLEAAS